MPAKEFVDWSVRRRYDDWIRQLVEARAPGPFVKHAGKQRFVATVVQEILDKVLLEITLTLPDDVVARILREVKIGRQGTMLRQFSEPDSDRSCICCGTRPAIVNPYPEGSNGRQLFEKKPLCRLCLDDPAIKIDECRHGQSIDVAELGTS